MCNGRGAGLGPGVLIPLLAFYQELLHHIFHLLVFSVEFNQLLFKALEIHYISKCPIARKELYFNSVMCIPAEIKHPEIKIQNNIKLGCKCKKISKLSTEKRVCVCVLNEKCQQVM